MPVLSRQGLETTLLATEMLLLASPFQAHME
jgi:hypothetical protein